MSNLTAIVMLAILAFTTAGCHLDKLFLDFFSGPEDLGKK